MVQFLFLAHVGHVLLESAQASHPGLGLRLVGTHQVQALPGPFEDHREALVLLQRARQAPQGLGFAALADTFHLGDSDWKE